MDTTAEAVQKAVHTMTLNLFIFFSTPDLNLAAKYAIIICG